MNATLTVQRVRELLNYCPTTGHLSWAVYRNSQAVIGQRAGHLDKVTGYRVIGIDRKVYQEHRVAWLHFYGQWPTEEIDHDNHIRDANPIRNLRDVPPNVNTKNKSKSKANSSGYTGVYALPSGKWIARICVDRKIINLGTFPDRDLACAARRTASLLHNFHPNHGL